jgi:uncharacterized membrane protein
MSSNWIYLAAVGIGIVAGLRSFTAPAAVAWAAHLGWLNLSDSPFAFMGSTPAVATLSILAVGELLGDKWPKTPKRTAVAPLLARILMGGVSGACLFAVANQSLPIGGVLGGIGGVIGAFGGYEIRSRLVQSLKTKDIFVALCEDIVAIGLALFLVSR